MAKKSLLKERNTNEDLYPITSIDCVVDFPGSEVLYNTITYGVAWKPNVGDPELQRVGNLEYHKTLPIQSEMKGCIYRPKEKKLVKWLNPSNWNKRSEYGEQESAITGTAKFEFSLDSSSDIFIDTGSAAIPKGVTIHNSAVFEDKYAALNIGTPNFPGIFDNYLCITGISFRKLFADEINNTTRGTDLNPVALRGMEITLVTGEEEHTYKVKEIVLDEVSTFSQNYNPINIDTYFTVTIILDVRADDLEVTEVQKLLGATKFKVEECLNGYYGEIMVYVPEFYIRSWDEENRREVRISKYKINDTWEHQPAVYIGAYKDTVIKAVPSNMGYMSLLEVDSAVSICNNSTWYRGGNNSATYDDSPIESRRNLNKGRTNISRATFRTYERKAGKEILSYRQYKNIICWLWAIEYANFNSQAAYNPELTNEGFRQGGMGAGLTNMQNWPEFNNYNPIQPNGFTNDLGNNTGVKDLIIPAFDISVPAINDLTRANILASNGTKQDGKVIVTNITSNTTLTFHCTYNSTSVRTTYKVTGLTASGETLRFETGTGASLQKHGEISADGNIEIIWPGDLTHREFKFSEVKSGVNIVVEVVSSEAGTVYANEQTVRPFRWRGIENTFGDTWNNVDGIIIDADADNHPNNMNYVYTTDNPDNYGDDLNSLNKMKLSGLEIHQEGYIKEWDLGTNAEIIPRLIGGNTTQYKSDHHYTGSKNTALRMLVLGGNANGGDDAGFGFFYSLAGVDYVNAALSFRSACKAH